jgi:threonine/homoserine/homoserine lactone efflux protein
MHLGAFLLVSVILIVTPGPDTALTFKNALLWGRRGGVSTAAGVTSGLAVWALCSAVGVAALLRASAPAFLAVRIAGAAYLAYLGARALLAAVRARSTHALAEPRGREVNAGAAYRQGFLSNLGNPKIAVFFISVLPQLAHGTSFVTFAVLGALFCGLTFVWLAAYTVAVAKAGDVLRKPSVRRVLDGVTGLVLIGFGLRLATEQR